MVLKNSLPMKSEHVLFIRLTEIQRRLYKRFMEELITNRFSKSEVLLFFRIFLLSFLGFYSREIK